MSPVTKAPDPDAASRDAVHRLLAESRHWPLLSAAEERTLAQRIERGDRGARERMILANVRLVIALARRYQSEGVDLVDLVQEGMIGLICAVDRFDWRPGHRFSTYASLWVRKYVAAARARASRAVRVPRELARRTRHATVIEADLTRALGRAPTDAELAPAAGLSLEQVREIRICCQADLRLDRPVSEDDPTPVGELIAADGPAPDEAVAEAWRTRALRSALAALDDRERTVIQMRFSDHEASTLRDVAIRIGRSPEWARHLQDRALRRMARDRELAAACDVA